MFTYLYIHTCTTLSSLFQGSEVAAANAAWMLLRGPSGLAGIGFPAESGPGGSPSGRLDLAARLLERAAKGGKCAPCAVELGNLIYTADGTGISRQRNLTQVRICVMRVICFMSVLRRCIWPEYTVM